MSWEGRFLVLALILVVSYSSDQSNCWCHLNQNTTLTGTIELFAPKLNCSQDYVINNLFCLNISPTCYSCKCIITLICWPHDGNLDQKCPTLIDAIRLWRLTAVNTSEKGLLVHMSSFWPWIFRDHPGDRLKYFLRIVLARCARWARSPAARRWWRRSAASCRTSSVGTSQRQGETYYSSAD